MPWVGVAARLSQALPSAPRPIGSSSVDVPGQENAHEACMPASTRGQVEDGVLRCVPLQGRAFVFLPLPLSTGLPAHVNGCFELSRCASPNLLCVIANLLLSKFCWHCKSRFSSDFLQTR